MDEPYSYELPADRIAQRPCHPPDRARMLVVERTSSALALSTFEQLPRLLRPTDVLIFNETRVIPARLFGQKGTVAVELLLLKEIECGRWHTIGKPMRRLKAQDWIQYDADLRAQFIGRTADDGALVDFWKGDRKATREEVLSQGYMPIPPYIREGVSDAQDTVDYQTFFAKQEGSIAAPTASLHFTSQLMNAISALGCRSLFVTLHVGLSSIREIQDSSPPGSETYHVSAEVLAEVKSAKAKGSRVIAVGTTVVRALESAVRNQEKYVHSRATNLFIQPGFEFLAIDALITNFHLPNSTHLLLVEAFMGNRRLLNDSYQLALNEGLRFLSYGDGMFIA